MSSGPAAPPFCEVKLGRMLPVGMLRLTDEARAAHPVCQQLWRSSASDGGAMDSWQEQWTAGGGQHCQPTTPGCSRGRRMHRPGLSVGAGRPSNCPADGGGGEEEADVGGRDAAVPGRGRPHRSRARLPCGARLRLRRLDAAQLHLQCATPQPIPALPPVPLPNSARYAAGSPPGREPQICAAAASSDPHAAEAAGGRLTPSWLPPALQPCPTKSVH